MLIPYTPANIPINLLYILHLLLLPFVIFRWVFLCFCMHFVLARFVEFVDGQTVQKIIIWPIRTSTKMADVARGSLA